MRPTNFEQELRESLDAFETAVITPIVPGELAAWGNSVCAKWAVLSPRVENHLVRLHPKQLDEIAREDPEMFSRVDKLRSTDAALVAERKELDRLVAQLATLAPQAEPDECKIGGMQALVRKAAIEFVTHVKEQQVAVQTWYMEAFNRDRGVAD